MAGVCWGNFSASVQLAERQSAHRWFGMLPHAPKSLKIKPAVYGSIRGFGSLIKKEIASGEGC
jgi:hypothetical protein